MLMKNYFIVNLADYYNYKIIADEGSIPWIRENICNFGMYDDANYFLAHSLPASNEIIDVEEVPFMFPDKAKDKLDNIACQEQEILFPNVECKAIHFLGTSDYVDYNEEYRVLFSNGKRSRYPILMPDSWNGSLAWEYGGTDYKRAVKGLFGSGNVHWFYYHSTYFDLKEDEHVSSIILPFNPNVHILAITLECLSDMGS